MLGRVFEAADRRQQLNVHAVGAELIADHSRTGFVVGAGWIDGRDANQAGRKIHNLVTRALDFCKHAIGHGWHRGILYDFVQGFIETRPQTCPP